MIKKIWNKINLKKTAKYLGYCIALIFITLFSTNLIINLKTNDYLFNDVSIIDSNKVGLVLGTSKYLGDGRENLYFKYRIKATVELYNAKKIKYIIVSGDNATINYNEPIAMKKELLKNNIPDSAIYLDYAGFRTFDSVIRCKEVFQQSNFTIISQPFHNQRAIFIARYFNINAIGFNAKDVDSYNGFKTRIREYFARTKVFIDILFKTKPKFLGKKINVGN